MEPQQSVASDSRPDIPAPPPDTGESDSRAREEEAAVQTRTRGLLSDWTERAKTNQIKRDEMLRHCFFGAVAIIIIAAALILLCAMLIWSWHLMTPDRYHWLDTDQLEKLQTVVFSGAVSSLATMIGKRILTRNDNDD